MIAKHALKDGDWNSALANVPFANIAELPGEILIGNDSWGRSFREKETLWRIHFASSFYDLYRVRQETEKRARLANLILSGMDSFWFAVSMLGWDRLPRIDDDLNNLIQFHATIGERVVPWLDRIALLAPRFSSEGMSAQMYAEPSWEI